MKAPDFWWQQHQGWQSRLLAPLGWLYAATTARRLARPGFHAGIPVICCGNPTVGGSGKTTLALDLGARLQARGRKPAFLTRGYGGSQRVPCQVTTQNAEDVGDEALLLAALAPTYVGADRAATARLAMEDGADVLVMDDGLQNPTLAKTLSLLVVDAAVGFGNGYPIPAGPLRETLAAAIARCQAAVLIGAGQADARFGALPVLTAHLVADADHLAGQSLYAFAGIGRPQKFVETLTAAGAIVAGLRAFPDHYRYRPADLVAIHAAAADLGAVPVTTPKDAVRLPADFRAQTRVVGVRLVWDDPVALDRLLDPLLAGGR